MQRLINYIWPSNTKHTDPQFDLPNVWVVHLNVEFNETIDNYLKSLNITLIRLINFEGIRYIRISIKSQNDVKSTIEEIKKQPWCKDVYEDAVVS